MNPKMKLQRRDKYRRLNGDMCGWYADMAENRAIYNNVKDRNRVYKMLCPDGQILIWDEKEKPIQFFELATISL